MKKFIIILVILISSALMITSSSVFSQKTINVVCSLEAFAGIAKNIGGYRVSVTYLVPEGVSPHEYSLSYSDIEKLGNADLIVLANSKNLSLEAQIREQFKSKVIVDIDDYAQYNLTILPAPGISRNFHGYWLYPDNAIAIAKAIRDALKILDASNAEYYDSTTSEFIAQIDNLKKKYIDVTEGLGIAGKGVVLAVPGAAYVAYAFSLVPKGLILKAPGTFASASEISEIQEKINTGEIVVGMCPISLKNTKADSMLQEVISGAERKIPIIYVAIFALSNITDFLGMLYYNLGAMSSGGQQPSEAANTELLQYLVVGFAILGVIAILQSWVIFRYRKSLEEILHE